MANWELGRLWQTLTYFEIIPLINCWQKIFPREPSKENRQSITMIILVVGATSSTGKQVVEKLLAQNYRVRALVKDRDRAKSILGDRVELWQADFTIPETIEPEMLKEVSKIVYCGEREPNDRQGIEKLIKIATQSLPAGNSRLIFDFTNSNDLLKETWGAVDDVVMGGVSQSNIRLADNKAIFAGIVSTDNNGGFASVRTRNFATPLDLSSYTGIELRVIGDGKRYKFISRCEGKWDGISYCYSFDTVYDFPTVIRIPFSELIPVFRAKTVAEASQIDSSNIYSMQLMLSKFEYDGELNPKFEAGAFALEVEYIKAYGGQSKPQFIQITPQEAELAEVKNSSLNYTVISSTGGEVERAVQLCLEALN